MKTISTSFGHLRTTKSKSVVLATLLIGAMVTLLSAPVLAAGPAPLDQGQKIADTFSILLQGRYKSVVHGPTWDLPRSTSAMVPTAKQRSSTSTATAESNRNLLRAVQWRLSCL